MSDRLDVRLTRAEKQELAAEADRLGTTVANLARERLLGPQSIRDQLADHEERITRLEQS